MFGGRDFPNTSATYLQSCLMRVKEFELIAWSNFD
jgi:hypothetical protein